jgi:hypothetical protein
VSAVTAEEAVADATETPVERTSGGSPTRPYVVLEEIQLDSDSDTEVLAYQKVAVVEARNGTNALRKAFKELRGSRTDYDEATLAVIPEGQWKPTPVRAERKESITVAVGG